MLADVSHGSFASILVGRADVCFGPDSDQKAAVSPCPLSANSCREQVQQRTVRGSGAQLIPILATRYGWACPGYACFWTDVLNPL